MCRITADAAGQRHQTPSCDIDVRHVHHPHALEIYEIVLPGLCDVLEGHRRFLTRFRNGSWSVVQCRQLNNRDLPGLCHWLSIENRLFNRRTCITFRDRHRNPSITTWWQLRNVGDDNTVNGLRPPASSVVFRQLGTMDPSGKLEIYYHASARGEQFSIVHRSSPSGDILEELFYR